MDFLDPAYDNDCDGNIDEGAFVRTDILGNQAICDADFNDPNCVKSNLGTQCTSNLGRCERSGRPYVALPAFVDLDRLRLAN